MRRILLVSTAALLAIMACAPRSYALDWIWLHESADAMRLEDAVSALEKEPGSIDKMYQAGLGYLNAYKTQDALKLFETMLSVDANSVEGQWGRAECFRRAHRLQEAQQLLDEVMRRSPGFVPAYITLGYIAYVKMDFERCAKLTYSVIKFGRRGSDLTNYVRAYCLYAGAKGMIAHYGGPVSKAVNGAAVLRNLLIAQQLQPEADSVCFGLGSYYLLAPAALGRDPDKAIGYFNRAIAATPLFPDVYVRLAQAYKLKRQVDKYEQNLAKALELDPQNTMALDVMNGTCGFICPGGKNDK